MKIKEVVNISELDFIIRAQVAMAKETENLDLDKSVVTKGVHNLFDQPKYGKYRYGDGSAKRSIKKHFSQT